MEGRKEGGRDGVDIKVVERLREGVHEWLEVRLKKIFSKDDDDEKTLATITTTKTTVTTTIRAITTTTKTRLR